MRKEVVTTAVQIAWIGVCTFVGYNLLHIGNKTEVWTVTFLVVAFAGIFAIGRLARMKK